MRAIKQQTQKQKKQNSRFFEYFLNQYGEACTSRASDTELMDKMKMFFMDLAFGNFTQPKYFQYLAGDRRIIHYALEMAKDKLMDALCYKESLEHIAVLNTPNAAMIKKNPHFDSCLREAVEKATAYSLIIQTLNQFMLSGYDQTDGTYHYERSNPNLLLSLAAQFRSNPFYRNTKRAIF